MNRKKVDLYVLFCGMYYFLAGQLDSHITHSASLLPLPPFPVYFWRGGSDAPFVCVCLLGFLLTGGRCKYNEDD